MSDFNSQHNRAVWFDIPTIDLERAASFYRSVLGIQMHREQFQDTAFYVLDHAGGNGGCLLTSPPEASARGGLVDPNGDGRIPHGGESTEPLGLGIDDAHPPITPS